MKKTRSGTKPTRKRGDKSAPAATAADTSLWSDPFVHVLLVLAVGFAVYFNTITAPFFFDDYYFLVHNPAIRSFSFFLHPHRVLDLGMFDDVKNNFLLRPAAYFTFAVDYALHGLDVRGYHLVNLLIHLANALLVYLLTWLTLRTPAVAGGDRGDVPPSVRYRYLPLFCALLFVCHPLQTQAVTYIIQRFVPLVSFFSLGTLALYAFGRLSSRGSVRTVCYLLSLAACVLAMESKENAFTLPLLLCLYDFVFLRGRAGERLARLVPFLLTMAIIPVKLVELSSLHNPNEGESVVDAVNLVNFHGTSSWHYLITQFGVIATYLRLLLLPVNQNFDYDYPLRVHFFSPAVLLPLLLLTAIAGTGVWLLVRARDRRRPESGLYRITAFGIFWFFITLAVESSIVPIDDLIFEHRAYLPSVGVFMAALAACALIYAARTGKSIFTSRIAVGLLILAVAAYSVAGFRRNGVWKDQVTLWRDVVKKSPNKARAHITLGNALLRPLTTMMFNPFAIGVQFSGENDGVIEEAITEYRTAIRLKPTSVLAHMNLGIALMLEKKDDEAAPEFATAARLGPRDPFPHVNLGRLYEDRGDMVAARGEFLKAIALAPTVPDGHIFLGALLEREGRQAEALKEYRTAYRFFPEEAVRLRIAALSGRQGGR